MDPGEGRIGRRTLTKWSMSDTRPIGPPSASLRAYSPFLMECTDTASVMVSTNPDCYPVMRMRKLRISTSPLLETFGIMRKTAGLTI